MTTVREFSEKIGVRPCDVGTARIRLQREGEWPGEELREVIAYRAKSGKRYREVMSLSPEQQKAIIGNFIEMVEGGRTRIAGVIDFVRDYRELTEGGLPEETCSPRGQERDWPPHFIG